MTLPKFDPNQPPPALMIDEPDSFAFKTMTTRIPGVADQILVDHEADYPPDIKQAIQSVHDELFENKIITPLQTMVPDQSHWEHLFQKYQDQHWWTLPWYEGEAFFYRKLVEASGYFDHPQWQGHDPFLPRKREELAGKTAWTVLAAAQASSKNDTPESLHALLHFCLWGNRIDLSYTQVIQDTGGVLSIEQEQQNILIDDSAAAVAHLDTVRQRAPIRRIDFICDNAGTELLTDLVLTDFLLRFNWVDQIILRVKAHPTYVSDTTSADLDLTLTSLQEQSPEMQAMAQRFHQFQVQQRLLVLPHLFWNSSHFFWQMPTSLQTTLSEAQLVIVKGDANYRRLVSDSRWPTTALASDVIPYFPTTLLALRTLKSDPIVGLPAGLAAQLDQEDAAWRVNGKRGVIQMVLTEHKAKTV